MPVTLKAPRPLPYPSNPKTLGEHLRKRRHERGAFQKTIAKELRVNQWTYITWETGRAEPETRYWPRIISFLGHDPHPTPETLGEHLREKYRELGLPRKRAAVRLGIDEGTLEKYESGVSRPTSDCTRRLIEQFLRPRDVRS